MAEKIVFGADIDNVTIKNVNGVLVAVGGSEAAEDEVETLSAYTSPVEDDEHYVETTTQWLRHKPTQAVWSAKKEELKPRSAPVNESLDRQITALISVGSDTIRITPEGVTGSPVSNIDGKRIGYLAYNSTNVSITLNKNDYSNAKAFNEAFSGKTFTVTTKKRYAESEGHPVVKPTEIQVAYPTLPYEEHTYAPETGTSAYSLEYVPRPYSSTDSTILQELLALIDSTEHEVSYVVRYPDGSEISGTHTYTGKYLSRLEVSGYKNEASSYERWEFKPYVVEDFNGKLTVSPQTYTEGTL